MHKRTYVALAALLAIGAAVAWKLTRPDPHVRQPGARAVPAFVAADIDGLEIAEDGDRPAVHLEKAGDAWTLVAPVADRADAKAVAAALEALEKMTVADVLAESPDSWERLQVTDDVVLRVTVKKAGAPLATLLLGKTGRTLRLEGSPQVWSVQAPGHLNPRQKLALEVKLWRDREIVRFDREQLAAIEVQADGHPRLVARREAAAPAPAPADPTKPRPPAGPDRWSLTEGAEHVGGAIDESVPNQMLSALSRLDAAEFADGATLESAGLAAPRGRVAAVLADGSRREVLFGAAEGGEVHVKRPDSDRIWKLRQSSVDTLLKPPLQWRNKEMTKIPPADISRVEIARGGEKLVLERTGGQAWRSPQVPDLDSSKVQGLIASFQALRATTLVEPADLAATGLARPSAVVKIVTTAGATTTIEVGAEKDKSYYLRASSRPEVFTLADFSVKRFLKTPDELKKSGSPYPAGAGGPGGMPMMPPSLPPGR